MKKTGI